MLIGSLPCRDTRPKHGREHRSEGRQLPHHSPFNHGLEDRHFPGVEHGIDDLPIGGIPPNQEDFSLFR